MQPALFALVVFLATASPTSSATPSAARSSAQSAQGAGGYQVTSYTIDDGTTDSSLGLNLGGTLCWFQRFDTQPGASYDVISEVLVTYGFPANPGFGMPDGTPATVCVWEDPTDDGDPSDAVLLVQQATTVQNNDTNFLTSVPIPPVTVQGKFFVGLFLSHPAGKFPASRDTGTASAGRAFFVGTIPPNGPFDPAHLASAGHTQIFSLDTAAGGSLNSVWRVRAVGQGPVTSTYCTAKTNALGCVPHISGTGVPRASAFFGFVVKSTNMRNQKPGLLLYGSTGPAALPFQGGFLCVNSPLRRTVPRSSGGTASPANDCTGVYEIDMNAFARGVYGGTPFGGLLVVGTQVQCQWWGRDPGFPLPNNSALSDALQYPILP
ncbi:MAG TPA: hypothetical protein VM509_16190 [Planctomycetota bacterium]|nr:hypothetical protein [Planctomycetota bacterium]